MKKRSVVFAGLVCVWRQILICGCILLLVALATVPRETDKPRVKAVTPICECGVACDCTEDGKICACHEKAAHQTTTKGCCCGDACDCTPLDDICGCREKVGQIIFQRQIEAK